MDEYYKINVEVRNKNGKLIEDSEGHKVTRLQFEWYSWSVEHMEHLMRSLHRDLKILMPENQIYISAGVMHGIDNDPRMHTLMNLYSYYGPEDRFVIHT